MSMGREWLDDHAYELHNHSVKINTSKWRTKDGRELNICDMTNEHIKNCMNMIGEDNIYWWSFAKELLRRMGVRA